MARQLTPLGRLLLVLAGLSLLGYGLYKYGVLARIAQIVAPEKRAEGTVSRDDFGASPAPGAATAAPVARRRRARRSAPGPASTGQSRSRSSSGAATRAGSWPTAG